jgi:hypothetical protein
VVGEGGLLGDGVGEQAGFGAILMHLLAEAVEAGEGVERVESV